MSRLPTAVRKAVAAADQLHKEHYNPDAPNDGEPNDPPKGAEPQAQKPAEPPKEEKPAEPPKAEKQPEATPAVAPPKADPPPVDWEARFKTLQGKYNAEVPRLTSELRALQEKLDAMESAPKEQPKAPETKSLVTKEEIEDYGEDFSDFIRRVAREEAAQAAESVKPEIEQIKGHVAQTEKQTAGARVYAALDQNVPGWRDINTDPNFLTWLQEVDPYSGSRRSDLLSQAFNAGDANRVMSFFKGFAGQSTLVEPPTPAKEEPKSDIASLAGPGRSGGSEPPKQSTPKVYNRADIKKFYNDVQRGAFRNRPDEKAKIEREIGRQLNAGLIQ